MDLLLPVAVVLGVATMSWLLWTITKNKNGIKKFSYKFRHHPS